MLVAVAFARTSLGNTFPCCGQGEVASCASYSVVSQKTGAIHLLVFSPLPAFMNGCCEWLLRMVVARKESLYVVEFSHHLELCRSP
jgi:hypothetical protein